MIEGVFDRYGDPEVDQMVSMRRLVRKEEAKLFRGLPERFRVIPDFRLGVGFQTDMLSCVVISWLHQT